MKIIAIEEHYIDAEASNLLKEVITESSPYIHYQSLVGAFQRSDEEHKSYPLSSKQVEKYGTEIGEIRIEYMEKCGISRQILSCSNPLQMLNQNVAIDIIKRINNKLSSAAQLYPSKFTAMASLPWQNPVLAEKELMRCIEQLGMKGVLLMGRPGNGFIDALEYRKILKILNDLKIPLYIHPFTVKSSVYKDYYDGLNPSVSALFALGGWGWHHEAGIHFSD